MMDAAVAGELIAAVGAAHVQTGDEIDARYFTDVNRTTPPRPACVVCPKDSAEVAAVLKVANRHRIPVTAQGGRTGVVGAQIAGPDGLVLSLERMNRIVEIDPDAMTATVDAGCVLQVLQEAVEAEGMIFPLDLGARGSATIGGNIATNAGGLRVLRWGMMRDMVLGLEAVLADGTIVSALGKALKDNAGYDWKQLLIGSEGTLGVVTRAVLRLRPKPATTCTALLAVPDFPKAIRLLRFLEGKLGGALSSFEVMWDNFYRLVTQTNRAKRSAPLPEGAPFYALVEMMGSAPDRDADHFADVLGEALASGLTSDAVIAKSETERQNLWAVREDLNGPIGSLWPVFAFDVSMAIGTMEGFIDRACARVLALYPDARFVAYGHIGDGNLHLMAAVGSSAEADMLAVEKAVYEVVQEVRGSISAEHGVGTMKRAMLGYTRSAAEIDLMRRIRAALDPNGIMNPGKVFLMEGA